jgi:hypothetical protein
VKAAGLYAVRILSNFLFSVLNVTLTHNPSSRLVEKLIGSQLVKKISPYFMKPKVSLPRLQEPATCPYLEPDQSKLPEDPS